MKRPHSANGQLIHSRPGPAASAAEKHRFQILLPIAAVAIGMTIFGLVFVLVVPNS